MIKLQQEGHLHLKVDINFVLGILYFSSAPIYSWYWLWHMFVNKSLYKILVWIINEDVTIINKYYFWTLHSAFRCTKFCLLTLFDLVYQPVSVCLSIINNWRACQFWKLVSALNLSYIYSVYRLIADFDIVWTQVWQPANMCHLIPIIKKLARMFCCNVIIIHYYLSLF